MNDTEINYSKEAFLNTWNLTFLVVAMLTALGLWMVEGPPEWLFEMALLFTAAAELIYLGIVPRHPRFRRAVRAQKAAERRKPPSQKEIFQHLSRTSQRRYARLRKLEKDIETNYRKLSYASQGLLESHLRKIDGLLDSYLNLLYQKERFQSYAQNATEGEVVRAIADLREDMSDDSERVKSIKERRLHILEQRLSRFKKGHENLEIIEAQLETIEDVIKYIHEQSWTLQNPEEISFQLDTLLEEVEETQHSVQEIEEVFSGTLTGGLLDDLDPLEAPEDTDVEEQKQQDRSRLRQ